MSERSMQARVAWRLKEWGLRLREIASIWNLSEPRMYQIIGPSGATRIQGGTPAVHLTAELIESRSIPEPNSGCWLWFTRNKKPGGEGYGVLQSCGKSYAAHRASWIVYKGPIPEGMHVCHRCDNPCCVNPDHLFLGTPTDNMRDKVKKGRAKTTPRLGSKNSAAKLTEEQAMDILTSSDGPTKAAQKHGVSDTLVHFIRSGRAWPHLSRSILEPHKSA